MQLLTTIPRPAVPHEERGEEEEGGGGERGEGGREREREGDGEPGGGGGHVQHACYTENIHTTTNMSLTRDKQAHTKCPQTHGVRQTEQNKNT